MKIGDIVYIATEYNIPYTEHIYRIAYINDALHFNCFIESHKNVMSSQSAFRLILYKP
jgi:hypothetical protein